MIINNPANDYTLSSYNMQQKVNIMHSIRLKTSYTQSGFRLLKGKELNIPNQ